MKKRAYIETTIPILPIEDEIYVQLLSRRVNKELHECWMKMILKR